MRHPTEGVLRRLVDEPAGVSDADRQHVADCPVCLVGLAAAREDAAAVGAALRSDGGASPDPAAASGESLPPVPAGLDGSRVRLTAGPGVAAVWSQASGVPSLVVGRAVAPSASSSGVPFETVRDFLLSLPGLPEDLAAQLRTFTADASTLPIPVPADLVETSPAEVGGLPATVLESRDQTLAAVVWVDEGVVTLVGGTLSTDEVLEVAGDLG